MANTYLFNTYHPGSAFGVGSPWQMRFLDKKWAMHRGQDFPAIVGTPIPAAAKGEIFWNNPLGDYGNCVVIKHTPLDGSPVYYTLYGHLSQKPSLAIGKVIEAGATVGLSGNSGRSFGPHLHFEVIPQQFNSKGIDISLAKGHTTPDPLTFTAWGDLPHMIGTDAAGDAIVATTINGMISCKAVDTTGTLIPGTASSNSDLPGVTTPYNSANPGTQYWVVDYGSQTGRLYDNGVQYAKDYQTAQEEWAVRWIHIATAPRLASRKTS